MQYKVPDHEKLDINFKMKTYEEWFEKYNEVKDDLENPAGCTFVTQCIDYISNPTILKKNDNIINILKNDLIPGMSLQGLQNLQRNIGELKKECYTDKTHLKRLDVQTLTAYFKDEITRKNALIKRHVTSIDSISKINEATDIQLNEAISQIDTIQFFGTEFYRFYKRPLIQS